jgi:hypothetical protein
MLATETEQGTHGALDTLWPASSLCDLTLRRCLRLRRHGPSSEKTNWVLEILKLRKVGAIITLLDHATLHTYAAHALSNIASGRDGAAPTPSSLWISRTGLMHAAYSSPLRGAQM